LTYQPQDSFDDNGFLKREALSASFQGAALQPPAGPLPTPQLSTPQLFTQQPSMQQLLAQQQAQQQAAAKRSAEDSLNREAAALGSQLLSEVVDLECVQVGREVVVENEAASQLMQAC
jgi:hypothetical protein